MLVLTTMFINVSNNLPKTSYVKMIDIWLIFNLLLPFIEVLIHSYMDTLRYNSQVGSSLQVATHSPNWPAQRPAAFFYAWQ